jgi:hypothetical protein
MGKTLVKKAQAGLKTGKYTPIGDAAMQAWFDQYYKNRKPAGAGTTGTTGVVGQTGYMVPAAAPPGATGEGTEALRQFGRDVDERRKLPVLASTPGSGPLSMQDKLKILAQMRDDPEYIRDHPITNVTDEQIRQYAARQTGPTTQTASPVRETNAPVAIQAPRTMPVGPGRSNSGLAGPPTSVPSGVPGRIDPRSLLRPGDPGALRGTSTVVPGQNALSPETGNELLQGTDDAVLLDNDKQVITAGRPLPNIRPWVDIINYGLGRKAINDVKKIQLARKNTYYTAPQLSVRPIQDLSPEMLAEQQKQLSQMRSDYGGSDPVMNLLSKNTATAQREGTRNQQLVMRADNLDKERSRWDEQMRQNQILSGETAAKNLDREQEFADYRTGVNTAAREALKEHDTNALNQLGMNLDTAAQYNLSKFAEDRANIRQEFEDDMKIAAAADTWANRKLLYDEAKARYQKRMKNPAGDPASQIPNFRTAQTKALEGTWIGNLLTRSYSST